MGDPESLSRREQMTMAFAAHRERLIEAYRKDPTGFVPAYELGHFLSHFRASVGQSLPLLIQALPRAPDDEHRILILRRLVAAHVHLGEPESALDAARNLVRLSRDSVDDREQLGNVLAELGQLDEASAIFERIVGDAIDAAMDAKHIRGEPLPTFWLGDHDGLFGSFGELGTRFDHFAKARALGIVPDGHYFCRGFLDQDRANTVANAFLFGLIQAQLSPYVAFVADRAAWAELTRAHPRSRLTTATLPLPDGRALPQLFAGPYIQKRWHAEGRGPVLRLPDETRARGRAWLAERDVPPDAWFVTLHVRDGGYKNEPEDYLDAPRNAKLENYLPALRDIAARGGWVVRIGNASPARLEGIEGATDYANAADQADWKDIFLLADCRFFVGTSSGPLCVAQAFGTPTVATDIFAQGVYYGRPGDIVIPKLLRRGDALVPFRESNAGVLGGQCSPQFLRNHGVTLEDNKPEEIQAAVAEMLERLERGAPTPTEAEAARQRAFVATLDRQPFGMAAEIGRRFLEKYESLLDP